MVFVDASAMIALIAGEDDAEMLANRLDKANPPRLCSAISVWETVAGLCRSYRYSADAASRTVRSFLSHHEFRFVQIGEPELASAIAAYAQFGKGRHTAALNMGDCYAYACARTNRAKLLFKGDDFTTTDIDQAT